LAKEFGQQNFSDFFGVRNSNMNSRIWRKTQKKSKRSSRGRDSTGLSFQDVRDLQNEWEIEELGLREDVDENKEAYSRIRVDICIESKVVTLFQRVKILNTIFLFLNPHFNLENECTFFDSVDGLSVSVIIKHLYRDYEKLRRQLKPSKTLNQIISKKAGFKCTIRSGIEVVDFNRIDPMTWRRGLLKLKEQLDRRKSIQKVKSTFKAPLQERLSPGYSELLKKLSRAEDIIIKDSSFSLFARESSKGFLIEVSFSQTKKSNVLHTKQHHVSEFWLIHLPKWYASLRRSHKLSSSLFSAVLEYTVGFNLQLAKKVTKECQVCSMALTKQSARRMRKKEPRQTWAFKTDKPNILLRLCGELDEEEIQQFFFLMQKVGNEICPKIKLVGN